MKALVSVIIPTHNAERTISRCIDSILNQTYDNIEIICCDDCSTDNTVEVIKKYADKGVVLLRNETNMRAAFSRNRCINCAKGEFVAQIDDDDYCAPDRIERQVDFLVEHTEYDFVGSGIFYFDETGVWGQTRQVEGYAPVSKDFLWSSVFMNPTMTYRIGALKKVDGYRVAKETRRSQDYDMHMRMYAAGLRGYILPDHLVYYYRGKESYPKSNFEYRIDEAKIRYKNFKALKLMPKGFIFVLKPIVLGLVPIKVWETLKRKRLEK